MTVLSICQTAAKRIGVQSPSSILSTSDGNVILLRTMLERAVQEIRNEFPWPELQKQLLFDLVTNQANYPLPTDFDRFQNETLWNRTQRWPLLGPIDSVLWQVYKSGLITTLPRQRFRVKGWEINQFYVDPTPSSDDNGQDCVFEYISRTCIRPKTWVASTSWTGLQYCSYNGNIYTRGSTGAATTGTNAPTVTSGSVSDGSITWTFTNAVFDTVIDDSDEVILDNEMVTDHVVWMFKQQRGFDFEDDRRIAMNQKDMAKSRLQGATTLSVNRRDYMPPYLGIWSYPEGNY